MRCCGRRRPAPSARRRREELRGGAHGRLDRTQLPGVELALEGGRRRPVRLGEAADAAGLLGRPAVVLVVVVLRLGPLRPRLRIARLRLLGAGVVGQPACFVLGPATASESTPVSSTAAVGGAGAATGARHHGRDRRRRQSRGPCWVARVSSWPGGAAPVPVRATAPPVTATVAAVASPTPRSTGAGTGTRTGDACAAWRAPSPPDSRPAGTGGSGARGGLGGAMPSHDQPSGLDGTAGRPVRGTGGWGVPCPFSDRVVMNPLMNLGPPRASITPRATTVHHRAPNAFLTAFGPTGVHVGATRSAYRPGEGPFAPNPTTRPEPDGTERTTGRTPCTSS